MVPNAEQDGVDNIAANDPRLKSKPRKSDQSYTVLRRLNFTFTSEPIRVHFQARSYATTSACGTGANSSPLTRRRGCNSVQFLGVGNFLTSIMARSLFLATV